MHTLTTWLVRVVAVNIQPTINIWYLLISSTSCHPQRGRARIWWLCQTKFIQPLDECLYACMRSFDIERMQNDASTLEMFYHDLPTYVEMFQKCLFEDNIICSTSHICRTWFYRFAVSLINDICMALHSIPSRIYVFKNHIHSKMCIYILKLIHTGF